MQDHIRGNNRGSDCWESNFKSHFYKRTGIVIRGFGDGFDYRCSMCVNRKFLGV
jgi:hypothetical protein